ncbi:hypothetical protein BsIDN1_24570 [Bacillus safensis]|uniref:Thioredoxin domain-containing protein n=1 Tax=Bacillus safensis TaxID=561879 RepID=A0A5S9MA47_BACIA|nr:hypothetical protein BsIDN1_24570 [Bacillus safensis]
MVTCRWFPKKGKKTILHFWTTWCPSCKMELPEFEQIVKENQSDVDILTVNLLGAEQSKHAVAQFVKTEGLHSRSY